MAIPIMMAVWFALDRAAKSNTELGRRLRASDHQAWELAVERKRRELDELLAAEPVGGDS